MSDDKEIGTAAGSVVSPTTPTNSTKLMKQPSDLKLETRSFLRAPSNAGSASGGSSKIGRPCMHHATPKAGPPPRENSTMSRRESDDNFSSPYTDMYQETVKRFTRSSLSPEEDRRSSKSKDSRRTSFDLYVEATGRRKNSDQGVVLTADTENFIIGQKVWVGGCRPGQIAYIGETHFAPGEWAGIVLDEPNGKNDGCVSGKRYFQCEPKKGIFSRLTRLTLEPLSAANTIRESPGGTRDTPDRSRTVSPTSSIRSAFMRSPGKQGMLLGDRIIVSSGFGSRPGILRFVGETKFASGNWCGIELDEPSGKNDGAVDGVRYFDCLPKYGIFVPIAKVSLSPSSKKNRLSRAGSRESLTSVGTMNSIATTNTSRLRMSAQKKPSSIKPVTVQKSTFSMQDVIREKQNHLEQLMIERDLDREDSQTQALHMQKNISELQNRILELEKLLNDEKKKTEELQFSVEEATFCGDELNAQTQEYKEKIGDLEEKLLQISTGDSSILDSSDNNNQTSLQLQVISAKLQESSAEYEAKLAKFSDQEKNLQDNVKYLLSQNEELQHSVLNKDSHAEKLLARIDELEKVQQEIILRRGESDNESSERNATLLRELSEKDAEIKNLFSNLQALNSKVDNAEKQKSELEIQMQRIQDEHTNREKELSQQLQELQTIRDELSLEKLNSKKLIDDLKEATGKHESKQLSALEQKEFEIQELKEEANQIMSERASQDNRVQQLETELNALKESNKSLGENLGSVQSAADAKSEETVKKELQIQKLIEEMEALKLIITDNSSEMKVVVEEKVKLEANVKAQLEELKAKTSIIDSKDVQLTETVAMLESFKTSDADKAKQIEQLAAEADKKSKDMHDEAEKHKENHSKQLESLKEDHNSVITVLNTKVTELDTVNKAQIDLIATKDVEISKIIANCEEQKASISSLSGKITDFEQMNSNSTEILNQKNSEIEELKTNIEKQSGEAKLEIEELNAKLTESENMKNQLDGTCKANNEELAMLKEQLKTKEAFELQLNTQMEDITKKLSISKEHSEKLSSEKDLMNSKLTESCEAFKEKEEKLAKQELEYGDICRKFEALNTKCENLTSENNSLQTDLNAVRTSSTDSNDEIVKLSQEIAIKQKAYQELVDKSTGERIVLENSLQEAQQRITSLNSELVSSNEKAQSNLEAFESYKIKIQDQLTELKSKYEAQISEKKAQFEKELSEVNSGNSNLKNQLDEAQKSITTLSNELSSANSQLSSSKEDAFKSNADFESIKIALEAASEKSLKELKTNYELQISDMKTSFETKLQQSESTKKNLDEAISKLQIQIKLLNDDLENGQKAIKSTQTELEQKYELILVEMKAQYENKLLCTESEKSDLSTEVQKLRYQIKELQNSIQISQSKETELHEEITKIANEKASLNAWQSDSKKAQIDYENSLQALQAELERVTSQNTEQATKIAEMQKGLIDAELINTELAKENAELIVNITSLDKEKCEITNNFELFELESDKTQHDLQKTTEEIKAQVLILEKDVTFKNEIIADLNKKAENLYSHITLDVKDNEDTETADLWERSTKAIKKLNLENSEKFNEIKSLQEKIYSLEESIPKADELQKTTEEIKAQVLILEKDVTFKNEIIAELNKKAENLYSHIALDVKDNEDTQATDLWERSAKAIKKLNTENSEKLIEIKSLREKIYSLEESIPKADELQKTTEEIKAQVLILEKDVTFKNEIIADLNKKAEHLYSHIALDVKDNEDTQAADLWERSVKAIKKLNTENSEKLIEIKTLREKIYSFEESIPKADEELQKLTEECAFYQENARQLEETVEAQNLNIEQLDLKLRNQCNEKSSHVEEQHAVSLKYTSQVKRLEMIDADKNREIQQLKEKINDLQSISNLKAAQSSDSGMTSGDGTNEAQINFLNSIIADMQKKNDTLKTRIEALESMPTDFTKPSAFNDIVKRKPAPRLFCDICDEFDLHETEDCPLQSSESPTPPILPEDQNGKERKLPPPRKYCQSCEVFGHEVGECDDDECY